MSARGEPAKRSRIKGAWQWIMIPVQTALFGGIGFWGYRGSEHLRRLLAPEGAAICAPPASQWFIEIIVTVAIAACFIVATFNMLRLPYVVGGNVFKGTKSLHILNKGFSGRIPKICLIILATLIPVQLCLVQASVCLAGSQVHYRSSPLSNWITYDFAEVVELRPYCSDRGRHRFSGLGFVMHDGTYIDFSSAYLIDSRIRSALAGIPMNEIGMEPRCGERLREWIST